MAIGIMKLNKTDQIFAEAIARQYQERTGKTNEYLKNFVEVFRQSVAYTIIYFKQSYREIFNELPIKSYEDFYKMVFCLDRKLVLEDAALPPCMTKDFFDGNFDEIRTGGRAANIFRRLEILIVEKNDGELASLATSWGISKPKFAIFGGLDLEVL